MMHVGPLATHSFTCNSLKKVRNFFRFCDWLDIAMEELLVKKFEEVKKILTIIKPLLEIGYDIGYGESIVPDEMRKTYK